ncbi:hypothetical protein [Kitasatospora sp. NPDC057223]|uniref:hypothetical protein n=1 Tax=Kitasatospora sp. NPDC057223 TaxID=3346055 RepID=UPI003635559C
MAQLIRSDPSLPGAPERDSISRCLASDTLPAQQGDAVSISVALARLAGVDRAETAARARALWVAAARAAPREIPLDRMTALAVGVRPAIVGPRGDDDPSLPRLPVYVERAHDRTLRAIARRAAEGNSEIALVVGEQRSGRTRACWEALQTLPAGWTLWQPDCSLGPESVAAAVTASGPRTVLWLGDLLRQWLSGPDTALWLPVVAEIAEAVHSPAHSPLLVMACLDTDTWTILEQAPRLPAGEWMYLLTAQPVIVPAVFEDSAVATAALHDPRLQLALHHSPQGHIAAFLCDHRQVTSAQHSEEILVQSQEAALGGDAYALHTVAALLDQTKRSAQVARWYRRAAEAGCADAVRPAADLMHKAEGRAAAVAWLRRQAEHGDSRAALVLAQYLNSSGPPGSSLPWYRRAAEGGQRAALHPAAAQMRRAGRNGEALRWLRARAVEGQREALLEGAFLLRRLGHTDRALSWYEKAADAGAVEAFRSAGDMLREVGFRDQAVYWYRQAAEGGDLAAARSAAQLLYEGGQTEEALDLYEWTASLGDVGAMRKAAVILYREGQQERALGWYEQAADTGNGDSAQIAASLLRRAGRIQEAFTRYRQVANAGNSGGLREGAWMLCDLDRFEEALSWLKVRAATGHKAAFTEVAELLRESGRTDEAITWYGHAADIGSVEACLRAAALVEQRTGNIDDALHWYSRATRVDNSGVLDMLPGSSHSAGPAPGVMAFSDAPQWPGFPTSSAESQTRVPVAADSALPDIRPRPVPGSVRAEHNAGGRTQQRGRAMAPPTEL